MYSSKVEDIRRKMNEFGKKRKPFVFGVNFELTEGFFLDNPLEQKQVFFEVEGKGNVCALEIDKYQDFPKLKIYPLSYDDYKHGFDIVNKGLREGYSFLTNLTVKTPISINLSLVEIFMRSTASYKLLLENKFVCFSPERFVKIKDKRISTNPMKGTIDASIPDAQQLILKDFKETAEHNTIVDLLRNDLSIVSDNVTVDRFRYIDHIKTQRKDIFQVSSEISGDLKTDYVDQYGDIIFSMLPAGSVSGAPKSATLQLIEEAEQESRGYYTGVFGYFDGEEFDSAVIIRFIEKSGDKYFFRSGGGITAYSDCKSEYEEVLNKIYLPII